MKWCLINIFVHFCSLSHTRGRLCHVKTNLFNRPNIEVVCRKSCKFQRIFGESNFGLIFLLPTESKIGFSGLGATQNGFTSEEMARDVLDFEVSAILRPDIP